MNIVEIKNGLLKDDVISNVVFNYDHSLESSLKDAIRQLEEKNLLPESLPSTSELVAMWDTPTNVQNKMFQNCIFDEIDLRKWQFDNAHFINCHFKKCSFNGSLAHVYFSDCEFEDITIEPSANDERYDQVSFMKCTFNKLIADGIKLKSSSFNGCIINDASFIKMENKFRSSFDKCSFTNVNFSGSILKAITFNRPSAFINVDLSNCKCPSLMAKGIEFSAESKVNLIGTDFSLSNFENCKFCQVAFTGNKFIHTMFDSCIITKENFEHQDLTNVWFSGSELSVVSFDGCLLDKTDFSHCNITQCAYSSSSMQMSNFKNSAMEKVQFHSCILKYSLFNYATSKEVVFDRCDLLRINCHRMQKDNTKFYDCNEDYLINRDEELYEAENFY